MKFSRILTLVLMCLIAVSTMSAAFATSSVTYSATPIAWTMTDWTGITLQYLDFAKFNSALGTLVQVDLSVTAGITSTLTVTNTGESSSSGNAKTHLVATVVDPGSLLTLYPEMYTSPYVYSLTPGASVTSGGITASGTNAGFYTTAAIRAEFTGIGYISLPTSTFTETVLSNTGGNTNATQTTLANASGSVTYWYDAPETEVPEPSSIILAIMGMTGIGSLRRFRKQR